MPRRGGSYQARREISLTARLVLAEFVGLNGLLLPILKFKIPLSSGIYIWSSLE